MSDELGPAIAALQRKLEDQLQGVADTKRTINMLLKMSGQPEQYAESDNERSGYVRSDQFYGKGVATAAAEYLAMRKQACQPDEILSALKAGGFDFDVVGWPENDRLRSLAISLAKNTGSAGKFHRLKNGAFGLRSWYDEDFLKKAASGAEEAKAGKAKKKRARLKAKPIQAARQPLEKSTPIAKPKLVRAKEAASNKEDAAALDPDAERAQSA
ncbi:MAG TPA: hypothetical protein VMQ56_09655 [Terracidiphilus sp.]|jgi:hypothetical protein|nr:hypothetical protein [Terracidiphilus sp.]